MSFNFLKQFAFQSQEKMWTYFAFWLIENHKFNEQLLCYKTIKQTIGAYLVYLLIIHIFGIYDFGYTFSYGEYQLHLVFKNGENKLLGNYLFW